MAESYPIQTPMLITPKKETRNFTVKMVDGTERGNFTGKQPRAAALKAFNKLNLGSKNAPATLSLREKGTKKIHIFSGYVEKIKAPDKRPKWMPEMVQVARVKKISTDKGNPIW